MATKEELKEIREQKKLLAERHRALLAASNEGKEERKAMRKQQAEARKQVRDHKTEVRVLSAVVYKVFSEGTPEEILKLADDVAEAGEKLSAAIRSFGEASVELSKL